MQNIVNAGTGARARVAGIEVAGKTGTSNDSIDAWFCGYTPEILIIVWYGNDNYKPMRHVEGGSRTAAPVFARFLSNYLKIHPETKRKFDMPSGVFTEKYYNSVEYYTKQSPLPEESVDINATSVLF